MKFLPYIFQILCCLNVPTPLFAQHNIHAGSIHAELVGDVTSSLTLSITALIYADSLANSPDSLEICFGDGNCELVSRVNGPGMPPQGEQLDGFYTRNIYQSFHTYPALGTYSISLVVCCYPSSSTNIPDSENQNFVLNAEYTFPNPTFQGSNSMPVLIDPNIDHTINDALYTTDLNIFDSDLDSISYELVEPLLVENYQFPDEFLPNSSFSIDSITGTINWAYPELGLYHYGLLISEFRDGISISKNYINMELKVSPFALSAKEVNTIDFKIFPNPTNGQIKIQVRNLLSRTLQIIVMNTLGQVMLHQTLNQSPVQVIDLSALPKGTYFIKILSDQGEGVKKIIIW